jgi:hypothetical protein
MLESLKPGMTTPEIVRCPDGRLRRVIYGLGPYIADYPEQALLTSVVQGWCARFVFLKKNLVQSRLIIICIRCLAPPNNLDRRPEYPHRCKEHTELLVECLELGVLWDEYGLVGDVVVCSVPVHFFSFLVWFSSSCFFPFCVPSLAILYLPKCSHSTRSRRELLFREFDAGPLFDKILPLLMERTLED